MVGNEVRLEELRVDAEGNTTCMPIRDSREVVDVVRKFVLKCVEVMIGPMSFLTYNDVMRVAQLLVALDLGDCTCFGTML